MREHASAKPRQTVHVLGARHIAGNGDDSGRRRQAQRPPPRAFKRPFVAHTETLHPRVRRGRSQAKPLAGAGDDRGSAGERTIGRNSAEHVPVSTRRKPDDRRGRGFPKGVGVDYDAPLIASASRSRSISDTAAIRSQTPTRPRAARRPGSFACAHPFRSSSGAPTTDRALHPRRFLRQPRQSSTASERRNVSVPGL